MFRKIKLFINLVILCILSIFFMISIDKEVSYLNENIILLGKEKTIPNSPTWHDAPEQISDNFMNHYGIENPDPTNINSMFTDDADNYRKYFIDKGASYFMGTGSAELEMVDVTYRIPLFEFDGNSPGSSSEEYEVEKINVQSMSIYSESGGFLIGFNIDRDRKKHLVDEDIVVMADEVEGIFYKEVIKKSDGSEVEGYTLHPTYDPTDENVTEEEKWVELFELKNGALEENLGNWFSPEPIASYSWGKGNDYIEVKITKIVDWVEIGFEGSYHFATFIEIDYDEFVVRDENDYYSLENDVFGVGSPNGEQDFLYKETQRNFDNLGMESGASDPSINLPLYSEYISNEKTKIRPYFTKDDTYIRLKDLIIYNNIVESRDDLDLESGFYNITFYDEYGNEIEENTNLSSPIITFDISTIDDDIYHTVESTSPKMTYKIPFIDMSFNTKVYSEETKETTFARNIYDYDNENGLLDQMFDDYTDNNTDFNWIYNYEKGKWQLKTNVPFTFVGKEQDGIEGIIWKDNNDPFNKGSYMLEDESNENELISITHEQIYANRTQNINYDVSIFASNNVVLNFDYIYKGKSDYDAIQINSQNESGEWVETPSILEDYDKQMIAIDTGLGKDVSSEDILYGYVVDEPVKVSIKEGYSDETFYVNEAGSFAFDFESDQKHIIDIPGVYGVSAIDEYGNNSFTVIEYVDPSMKSRQNSMKFEETKDYSNDIGVFMYQDYASIDLYDNMESVEYRFVNEYIENNPSIIDLEELLTQNELNQLRLQETTNQFKTSIYFNEDIAFTDITGEEYYTSMKKELEKEIDNQLQFIGLNQNQYKIEWGITDNTIISNDMEISCWIVPSGYWETKGRYQLIIDPQTYVSLDNFTIDKNKLSNITNDYVAGVTKDGTGQSISGNEITLDNAIKKEIIDQLLAQGLDEGLIDMDRYYQLSTYPDDSGVFDSISITGPIGLNEEEPIMPGDTLTYSIDGVSQNGLSLVKDSKLITFESRTRLDLSKVETQPLNNMLAEVTSQYFVGASFKLVRGNLEKVILDYLNTKVGANVGEVSITFDKSEYSTLQPNEIIKYTVESTSAKYTNEIHGSFIANPFTDLSALIMNDLPMIKITNGYNSGSQFGDMESELTEYVYDNLSSRGLEREYITVSWDIESTDVVDYSKELSYSITSNDPTLIQGEYNNSFKAWNYYDLNSFVLDYDPINEIMLPYLEEGSVLFSVIQEDITNEVKRQLDSQGIYTSITLDGGREVDVIDIEWNRGLGEKIYLGQELKFTVTSDNVLISNYVLLGEVKENSIQFGERKERVGQVSTETILIVILIILILTIIVFAIVTMIKGIKERRRYN